MSDLLVVTLTLIGSIGACFAKPCSPEYWSLVKAGYRLVGPESAPAPGLMAEMFETAQWAKSSEAAASLVQMAARGATGDGPERTPYEFSPAS